MSDCKACKEHYGDAGPCDEGKAVASPHAAMIAANRAAGEIARKALERIKALEKAKKGVRA